jgi:hypothetical protein
MFKRHIRVNGRNLSIGMTFIESRAGWALTPTCPVKFFEEKEQSEFNRGALEGKGTVK